MAEGKTYRTVHAMSLPLLDEDGNPREPRKEILVHAGQDIQLSPEIAGQALRIGAVRELTGDEERAARPAEQENVPPSTTEQIGEGKEPMSVTPAKLERPANNARTEDWIAFAQQEGVDPTGTRAEIIARIDAVGKLEAQ